MRCAEASGLLRGDDARVAASREFIHALAADGKAVREVLGGLAHQEAADRIGQAAHQADHRVQQFGRTQFQEHGGLLHGRARRHELREPHHHAIGIQERCARQRVHAAGEDEVAAAGLHIGDGGIDGLHARGAVAHHRPARHLQAATHAQRGDAADVDLVHRGCRAAKDDFIQFTGLEGLARQQHLAGPGGHVAGGERPGAIARFQEWRADAIDDVNGFVHAWLRRASAADERG